MQLEILFGYVQYLIFDKLVNEYCICFDVFIWKIFLGWYYFDFVVICYLLGNISNYFGFGQMYQLGNIWNGCGLYVEEWYEN